MSDIKVGDKVEVIEADGVAWEVEEPNLLGLKGTARAIFKNSWGKTVIAFELNRGGCACLFPDLLRKTQ